MSNAQPEFQFEVGELSSYQTDAEIAKLENLRHRIGVVIAAKRLELEFYEALERQFAEAHELITALQSRIKSGEFEQPQPNPPTTQPDVEERHRAPF